MNLNSLTLQNLTSIQMFTSCLLKCTLIRIFPVKPRGFNQFSVHYKKAYNLRLKVERLALSMV